MDALTFIERMTSSLAWPIAAAVILFLLRKEIRALLGQVSKLKIKDIEIDVAKDFSLLQAESAVVLGGQAVAAKDPERSRFEALLSASPKTVILESWKRLEKSISQLLMDKKLELGEEDFKRPILMIERLLDEGLVEEKTYDVVRSMYLLRNKVKHYEPLVIRRREARSYYENALKMLDRLRG